MVTSVTAPYAGTYAGTVRYVTVEEFLSEPTGVDLSQLVPGRGPTDQRAAAGRLLDRASGIADNFCNQHLAASLEVESGQYRVRRDGRVAVPCAQTPIVQVTGIEAGWSPTTMTDLTDLSGTWIDRKVVEFPWTVRDPYLPVAGPGRLYVVLTYVAGYCCTTLAAPATPAATSITVRSGLGIFPGMSLLIPDGASTETVTVAAGHIPGAATVPLAAGLANAHAAGAGVDALPGSIKQAVLQIASGLVRTRANDGLVMAALRDSPGRQTAGEDGKILDLAEAASLLQPFARVM